MENARAFKALVNPRGLNNGLYYINIDEGWWRGERNADTGAFQQSKEDARRFPHGMKVLAKQIHDLGFKTGIYTDGGGPRGCKDPGYPAYNSADTTGSAGHYEQDFGAFLEWGYDFVKVDWCGNNGRNTQQTYRVIAQAIWKLNAQAAANPYKYASTTLALALCEWGNDNVWNWAAGVGWIWRTGGDVIHYPRSSHEEAPYDGSDVYKTLLTNYHPEAQHTGYYNDADMMMIGKYGWTAWQNKTHMSLWAIMASPLINGGRLWTADPGDAPNPDNPAQVQKYPPDLSGDAKSVLTNRDIIAIDQDRLGLQGIRVKASGTYDRRMGYGYQVWSKLLLGSGRRAVLFLNRMKEGSAAADLTVAWKDLGLDPATTPRIVRDVWGNGTGVKIVDGAISVSALPANNVVVLVIEGKEPGAFDYEATPANKLNFTKIRSDGKGDYIRIAYVNTGAKGVKARMKVSSGLPDTTVFLPSTGGEVQAVTVYTRLKSGADNTIAFTADTDELDPDKDGPLPDIRVLSTMAGPKETSP